MSVLFTLIIARQLNWRLCAVLGVICLLTALIIAFILPRKEKLKGLVLLSAAFALGLYSVRCAVYVEPIRALDGVTSEITASVTDEPIFDGDSFFYRIRVDNVAENNIGSFNAVIQSRKDLKLSAFDDIAGTVTFYEGLTDAYYSENAFICAYVNAGDDGFTVTKGKSTVYRYAIAARGAVRDAISGRINTDEGALMTSVLIGDKSMMSEAARDAIRVSGISHITVVSGLHLSILMSVALKFFNKLLRSKRKASIPTLIFVAMIMALAGFTPSVIRSGLTCTIYLLGNIIFKRSNPLHSLCISSLLQCLLNPFAVYSLSFLLTTFSTLGIITLEPKITPVLHRFPLCRFNVCRAIASTVSLSLSAQLMTLPIIITVFEYVTPLSVLTNVVINIPVTLLVSLTAISSFLCITEVFGFFGDFLMLIAGLDAKLVLFVAEIMSKPSFSSIYVRSSVTCIFLGAICLVIGGYFLLPRLRCYRMVALMVSVVTAVSCFAYSAYENSTVTITSFATDKGAAVLIRDGNYTALIGSTSDSYYAETVGTGITYSGIKEVDLIILPECEEFSGAAPDLMRHVSARRIIYNDDRLDLMKLDGTLGSKYTECNIVMTDRASAEINSGYIMLTVCGKEIVIPTARVRTPDCDVIISPYEFITTTSSAKYAIISGSVPLALNAGEKLSPLGTTSYIVGEKEDLNVHIRGNGISFSREK